MKNSFLLMIIILFPFSVHAETWGTDCTYNIHQSTITLPSNVNISIDPNAPVGQVLYRYTANGGATGAIKCDTAGNFGVAQAYFYESGGDTVTLNGKRVYKTDVPGIGLIAWWGGNTFPYTRSTVVNTDAKLNILYSGSTFDVELIKYDDIPAGTRMVNISALNIPVIDMGVNINNSSDTGKLPNGNVPLIRFTFASAAFSVLNATCDTSDVSVNLGVRNVSDTGNRESGNFASPWVDASIRLTNCPIFYGTGKNSNPGTTVNNIMTVTLIPNNATTSNQGIMPVDTGTGGAEGVGIQLAYGTSALPQFVDFSAGKGTKTYTMSSTQGSAYTIPLVARYIQTAASLSGVSPGPANGKATYLINYY